jgi:CubicO group peptidase (beta-lactamase class C family)
MKLVEAGKLKLNDKVFGKGAILGTSYGTYPYRKYVDDITVEDLLECLAGGWPTGNDPDPLYMRSDLDRDQLISWTLDNIPLHDKPGTHYNYSSFGFILLGRVIEKISRLKYEDFVRQNVLTPCGITAMRIGANPESGRVKDEVHYYDWNPKENPYTIGDVPLRDAAGGWIASPTDLVKFLTHLDNLPEQPEILARTTRDTMFSAPVIDPGYAKGWIKNTDNDALSIGVMPGQGSAMCLEQEGFAWAALVNRRYDDQMSTNLFYLMWQIRRTIKHWPGRVIEN